MNRIKQSTESSFSYHIIQTHHKENMFKHWVPLCHQAIYEQQNYCFQYSVFHFLYLFSLYLLFLISSVNPHQKERYCFEGNVKCGQTYVGFITINDPISEDCCQPNDANDIDH